MAIRGAAGFQSDMEVGQFSLFESDQEEQKMPDTPEWPESNLLTYEREVLGTYVSAHPLTKYEKLLKNFTVPIRELKKKEESGNVIVGGIVHSFAKKVNSKNEETLHFILEDMTDKILIIAQEKIIREKHQGFEENMMFLVRGRISYYSDDPVIFLESLIAIDDAYSKLGKFLHIKLREIALEEATSKEINSIISAHKGDSIVVMHILTKDGREVEATLADDMKIKVNESILMQLESILGAENVWLSWKK